MKRVVAYLLATIIFLTPTNLFLKFFVETGYSRGLFIDYLLPKLYLSDIFIATFILVGLCLVPKKKIRSFLVSPLFLLVIIISAYQFFTPYAIAGSWFAIHLIKIVLLFFVLTQQSFLLKNASTKIAFVITVLFQSLVGLYQFLFQKSVAGYWFLGEQNLSQTLGIVRQQLGEREVILPYGTTAHPNLLGGTLVLFLLICWRYWRSEENKKSLFSILLYITTPLAACTVFATQSMTAWAAAGIGFFVLWSPLVLKQLKIKQFFGLVLGTIILVPFALSLLTTHYPDSLSITRRNMLNTAATEMIFENAFFGVGLNQFTTQLENYTEPTEIIRFVQPVHHVGLLWIAETGLLGVLLIAGAVYKLWRGTRKLPVLLLVLLPITALDHYFLTLQSGALLVVLSIFVFTRYGFAVGDGDGL